ncbi:LysM peptidoglycan-binding domain-containing protein [Georgenia sp. TF02-10]|uniref:LysM peptidoglycan-binding domain-containing protein n=1 Tax=Georgenia sp. TF02-10 TaxID=2917725 RepID=UPI001FA6DA7F|nr:LysM peptidoglycan-binding domain-containing protein [Georgenia sp. TF02-10]UNX53403.1 LysM peptidoglycan-binding domain-containing protein [Georgenia sp. TF02-10]
MTAKRRSRTAARTPGRAGVGLALAATTAVGVVMPAHAAQAVNGPAVVHRPPSAAPTVRPAMTPTMTYQVQAGDTVTHIAARTGSSVAAIARANGLDSRALIRVGQMLRIPSPATASTAAPAAPAPSAGVHTVKAGETVWGIARQHGTTVAAIVAANSLGSPDRIYVGQQLRLTGGGTPAAPAPTASPAAAPAATSSSAAGVHTVKAGETVWGIARQHGTTVAAIVAANSLGSPDRIYVGQQLRLGGGAPAPTAAPAQSPAPAPAPAAVSGSYTVRPGDTVSALARSWGTSVAAVVAANNLSASALIYVGQQLTIPGAPAPSTAAKPATDQLVPSTFLGRTYPEATVGAANANKATLLAVGVPSREQMQALVVQVARQMGVDPALAQAHAYIESGFNHASVSPANAIGTMQVIPSSGEWASQLVGRKLNLLDPHDNVVAGVAIIRQLVRTSPDLDTAIASYYQGAGSVQRNGLYEDTKRYVATVRGHMARF